MPSTLNLKVPAIELDAIYTDEWRERLHNFHASHASGEYWAYDFDKSWAKFRRGVQQELEMARLASHWINLAESRVLVIGSYFGSEAIAYALCGADVVGIDLDDEALEFSRQLAEQFGTKIDIRTADACNTPFADESFDYISCAQVLEHLPPPQQPKLLAELWRLCKPGGLIWLDTPNHLSYRDQHDTGLPFIHWLPRSVKVPLARLLGRSAPYRESAFDNQPVYLHYYLGYFQLMRLLGQLGRFEVLSRYKGYADIDHYGAARRCQGREQTSLFPVKAALLRGLLRCWNWNWFSSIRLMVRKQAA